MIEHILVKSAGTTATFALGAVIALFSPADIKEIIVAVSVFVAGVGVVIVNIITARSASRQRREQGQKLDLTLQKAAVIEGHVNSEKTKADGEIAALKQEVTILRQVLSEKRETAALLAQSAANQAQAQDG